MNKIIIAILITSLFLTEGCTVIGYSLGKGIQTKEELEIEKIKSIEVNDWLSISLKNSEVIKGQLISCVNDTLWVVFKETTNANVPISNKQFLYISHNKILFKISLDQINDIKIIKSDLRAVGMLLGIVVDLFMLLVILAARTVESIPQSQ